MDLHNQFESYLYGKLNKQELENFEKRLNTDMDFKLNFENHKRMQMAMDILVEEDVKKHIATLKSNSPGEVVSEHNTSSTATSAKAIAPNKSKLLPWLIAASVALLIIAGMFLMRNNTNETSSYMAAYHAPINDNSTRSTRQQDLASTYFIETKPAHDLIGQKKFKDAAQLLESYLPNYSGTEKQELEWYLALVLSEYDLERSRNLLYEISTTEGHPYLRKAKGLIAD